MEWNCAAAKAKGTEEICCASNSSTRTDKIDLTNEQIMTSLVFPDINVWLALSYHGTAITRRRLVASSAAEDAVLILCRHTQLGWFRLLTTEAVLIRCAFAE